MIVMVQYVDKSALVAEIERRIKQFVKENSTLLKNSDNAKELRSRIIMCKEVLSILNTLEVKEVDLEKEAELIANGIMIGVQANKYNTVVYNTKRNDFNHSHLMLAARKGIELGLKAAQKGKEI